MPIVTYILYSLLLLMPHDITIDRTIEPINLFIALDCTIRLLFIHLLNFSLGQISSLAKSVR
jgi:hypothetical protein